MLTRSKATQNPPFRDNTDRLPLAWGARRHRSHRHLQNPVGMNNQQDLPPHGGQNNQPRLPRQIGAGDAPNTHAQRQGIVPPAIPNNNFEIKSSTITMIQNNKFHGLPMEDPLDHLDEFDRLCGLTKINGVSEDAYKLRLFPFSLGDKAKQWEKALPQGSITSWDDCKKAFLTKWFSNSRTAKLRNEISSFSQKNGETFCETWERFKSYTSKCPHHGFTNESLLSTLYRGLLPKFRMMLNTASNGNFLNKDVEDGWELVENIAQSDGNDNEDYDRTDRSGKDSDSKTRKEMKALNDKLDRILLGQQQQVVSASEEELFQVQDGEVDQTEEISYMQNQGGYNRGFNNYRANPNLSYRSTNVANPQDQVYPQQQQPQQQQPQQQTKPFVPHNQNQGFAPKQQYQSNFPPQQQSNMGAPPGFPPQAPPPDMTSMFQQILHGQAAGTQDVAKKFAELNNKMECSYNDLNIKFEALNSKMKYMESNNTSTSSVKSTGQLPGKAIQNPKEFCNAIFSTQRVQDDVLADEDERAIEDFCSLLDDTSVENLVVESNVTVQHSIKHIDVVAKKVDETDTPRVSEDSDKQGGEDSSENQVKAEKSTYEVRLDQTTRAPDRVKPLPAEILAIPEQMEPEFIPPPYKPKLPFPGRFKKQLVAKYEALFDEQMKEVEAKMPLIDILPLIPESHKHLKHMVMEMIKETQGVKVPSKECSAVISEEDATPEKLSDPGSFTLPCSLGPKAFDNCLCDLGSSVSLMPLSVAKKLGFSKYRPCNISLILADRSVKKPHGLLEDLPVKVGSVDIPTDFIVLEMDEEPKDPLLLGRPFLATAGAVIDVKNGKIDLNLGKGFKMTFDVRNAMKKPTIGGQTFCIEEKGQLADASLEQSYAGDHPMHTCNAILIRDGDDVWEEEESDEDEYSEDDFSDCYGILTSNLARSRARKREKLAAEKLAGASSTSTEPDLPVKDLEAAPDDCSQLQALKRKSEWQEQTIRQLTISVRELACLVKGMKEHIEQIHGQTSGSPSREVSYGSELTVNDNRVKEFVVDQATPEGSPMPLCDPPDA